MKTFKTVMTVILCIIMAVSAAFAAPAYALHRKLSDPVSLGADIAGMTDPSGGTYYDAVIASVEDELARKMALVMITPEDIGEVLTDERLCAEADTALSATLSTLFGGNADAYSFEDEALLSHIEALLGEYAERAGVEYEEGSGEKVYGMICETVTATLSVIPSVYVTKISPVAAKVIPYLDLWYVFPVIWAVALVLVLVIGRRSLLRAAYSAALASYIGTFAVFVTAQVLYGRDYLRGTVLGEGAFAMTLRGAYNSILGCVRDAALVPAILFAVLFFAAVATGAVMRARGSDRDGDADGMTDEA